MGILVVEDGSGVAGANSLCSPGYAAGYHAARGNLTVGQVASSSTISFDAQGLVLGTGLFGQFQAGAIVQVEGSTDNDGFGWVDAATANQLSTSWRPRVVEPAGDAVTVTLYGRSGWWASTRQRLEAALVAATDYLSSAYDWVGNPVSDSQGTPWPRENVFVGAGSRFYRQGAEIASNEVPPAVSMAVALLSLEELRRTLLEVVDPERQLRSKAIEGAVDKTFDNPRGRRRFPAVDALLMGLAVPAYRRGSRVIPSVGRALAPLWRTC